MTCHFFPCDKTQQIIDDSVEHCVGKKVLVAGSSAAGIAIATLLAAEGADVAIIDAETASATAKVIEDQFHTVGQVRSFCLARTRAQNTPPSVPPVSITTAVGGGALDALAVAKPLSRWSSPSAW